MFFRYSNTLRRLFIISAKVYQGAYQNEYRCQAGDKQIAHAGRRGGLFFNFREDRHRFFLDGQGFYGFISGNFYCFLFRQFQFHRVTICDFRWNIFLRRRHGSDFTDPEFFPPIGDILRAIFGFKCHGVIDRRQEIF